MNEEYVKPGLNHALGRVVEEAGELMAALGKTVRFGFFAHDPEKGADGEKNHEWVRREMADVLYALDALEKEMTHDAMEVHDTMMADLELRSAVREVR